MQIILRAKEQRHSSGVSNQSVARNSEAMGLRLD